MHFAVLVIGPDVERQLALYGRSTRLSPYRQYVDGDEFEAHQDWFRRRPHDGVHPDHPRAVVRRLAGDDISSDRDNAVSRDERGWYYWSTRNWRARWDYWTIDERRYLLTKPDGAVVKPEILYDASPDVLHRPDSWQRAEPGQVLRGPQSCVAEVDFAAMRHAAHADAVSGWDAWQTGQLDTRDELAKIQIDGFTRDQYLARADWFPPYLVKDGNWHERGDLGLRANVSDERAAQWRAFANALIHQLPNDTLLTMVDCHT